MNSQFILYFCAIFSITNGFEPKFIINFSKRPEVFVVLNPHFKFELNGRMQEINYSYQISDSNCTMCQIKIQQQISDVYSVTEKMQFNFFLHTKAPEENEVVTRYFELSIYKPNFQKHFQLSLGNLATSGSVRKNIFFGEMINENQILLGKLSIELSPLVPLPNGRIREIHLGIEQIKIATPNSNNIMFSVGHFTSNVNFEHLHDFGGSKGKMILKIFQFIHFKHEEADELGECPICLAQFVMGNEQIVQIHPNKNANSAPHLFHLQCINRWFMEHDKMECPLCRFKHHPKTLKFLPLLSDNKQNDEQQNVLFLNYHQILEQILADEKSGTFKHRQAKGALIGFEKHIENLNIKIKQIFEGNEYKLVMQNGKIGPNNSIKTLKIMLKQILAIERGESSRNLLQELENVNLVLANIAKEAFDAIEMISEKDEEQF